MFKNPMGKTDEVYVCKAVEKSKGQEREMTGEYEEIDASNILTIRSDDGTDIHYIPYYDNGQIIMTPITLVKEESVVEMETADVTSEHKVEEKNSTVDEFKIKPPQFVECNGKLVKTVPIVDNNKTKSSTRVAPNTYKKTLVNNGNEGLIRFGRKHLIVDQKTKINPKSFKQQLLNSDDLVKKLDIAPRSRKQMRYMIEGFTQLFAYPAHSMSSKIRDLHTRHCTTRKQNCFETLDDMMFLPVGYQVDVDRSSLKRITRRRRCAESETKKKCLENTQENQIQVILETATNQPTEQFMNCYTNDNDSDNSETQIVVIQEDNDSDSEAEDNKNIEVLLEAVEKKGEDGEEITGNYQVFITNENFNESILEDQEIYVIDSNNEHYIQEKNEHCTYLTIKQ